MRSLARCPPAWQRLSGAPNATPLCGRLPCWKPEELQTLRGSALPEIQQLLIERHLKRRALSRNLQVMDC